MSETQELIAIMDRATESMENSHKSLTQRFTTIQKLRIALEEIAETTSDPGIERMARAALDD